MRSSICDRLGIEFPLFAFSHCRDVVVAVSRAGGMGVFGAATYSPEQLREELAWIDRHCGGKPYGIDLVIPAQMEGKGEPFDPQGLLARLPSQQRDFAARLLSDAGIDASDLDDRRLETSRFVQNIGDEGAKQLLDVAFSFPIKLIANALGSPPKLMLDEARKRGVPVAALVGTKEHAISHIASGVDVLVAAGGEAGGHCGDVSTMVLVPEVVSIAGDIPVLAAGGIVTGRQMAAAMAMGAAGAWCGSVWLTTPEAETSPVIKQKLLKASSRDTVRSRARTGKPSRQLRSLWTDSWESREAPNPLPMPLQWLVAEPALTKVSKLAEAGHDGAMQLATYWVGQGVGMMNEVVGAGQVVQDFKEDFAAAYERLAYAIGA